jgi:glutathione S-transferase
MTTAADNAVSSDSNGYTLYYAPGSASMVVHLALLEIGVPYRLVPVNFGSREQYRPDYLRLNPMGVVPTLVMDGKVQFESAALLLILAEHHPQAALAPPPGSPARDDWHRWAFFLSSTLGATFRTWFYPADVGPSGSDPTVRAALQRRIESCWEMLDAHLAAGGPYMLGSGFSGLDLQVTMLMRWSRKMPSPATNWPALRKLADLVRERPSWKKLYELEGLTEWFVQPDAA